MIPMVYNFLDIIIAFLIDRIAGDPYWMPHPVRFIGGVIARCEKWLRSAMQKGDAEHSADAGHKARNELIAGGVIALAVILAAVLPVILILYTAKLIHPILFHMVNIYFIYSALAAKCLADEAKKVYASLKAGDLTQARTQLSMLVGRQTDQLDEKEVIRGAVETTAENTVDGIVSPLFYAIIGSFFGMGAPLVWMFKAISTLDSMVGYMNDKYQYFGRISARADDVANYLPARLSGVLFIPIAAFLCRLDCVNSFRIMKRDRYKHKSPNCAWSEAAFAGALGIRIGGNNMYFGQLVEKPTIGDANRETEKGDIPKTIRLMYTTAVVALAAGIAAAGAVIFIVW